MREAVTTALEVLGVLLLAAGLGLWLASWSRPAGLAGAGALLMAASALASGVRPPRIRMPWRRGES